MFLTNFKKKKKQTNGMPDTHPVTLSTILPSFATHPIEYKHSYKFLTDGIDPLCDERHRIRNKTVDWLLHDMRDSVIEADSRDEITYGRQQFINHTHCIASIVAQNEGEIELAKQEETLILEELEYYKKQEAELNR